MKRANFKESQALNRKKNNSTTSRNLVNKFQGFSLMKMVITTQGTYRNLGTKFHDIAMGAMSKTMSKNIVWLLYSKISR